MARKILQNTKHTTHMKRTFISLLALGLIVGACQSGPDLEANFVNPPVSAKPHTWWH